jgi:peroxiredoxin
MLKATKIPLAAMILAGVLLATGCSGDSGTGQVPAVGGIAPDFTIQGLDGPVVSLANLRGKSVVLNFWATWCGPCRQEMPFLQEVSQDTGWAERGLVVLAVNLGEAATEVRKFMDDNGFSFTVLLDTTHEVGTRYNTRYIPTTYFIDKDGIIQNIKIGAFTRKTDIDRSIINMLTDGES